MDPTSLLFNLFSEYGVFTIIAPFLLIFSLVYGLLRKTNLFGKDNSTKEKLYAIISFAISFYYIYKLGDVIFTQDFISFFFFEILVLFFILMIIALLGTMSNPYNPPEEDKELYNKYKENSYSSIVGFLGLLVLFAFMYASSQSFTTFGQQATNISVQILAVLINSGLLPIIIIIGVLVGILSWATRSEKPKPKRKGKYLILAPGEAFYQLVDNTSGKK